MYLVRSNIADAMDLTRGEFGIVSQAERVRPIAWDNEAIFFLARPCFKQRTSPREQKRADVAYVLTQGHIHCDSWRAAGRNTPRVLTLKNISGVLSLKAKED